MTAVCAAERTRQKRRWVLEEVGSTTASCKSVQEEIACVQNCQPVAEMLANKNVEEAFVELSSGCKILALRDISSSLTGPGGGRALVRAHPLGSEPADATDAQVAAIAFRRNRRSPVTRQI